MQVKTKTVAGWNPQNCGKAKRDVINAARSLLRTRTNPPQTIEVPDDIWYRHTHGIDSQGRAFEYDTEPLPKL